ncbi:hypothetical protein ElyMa_003073100 [Elysia marginata]|uniref:MYND-type domain-containing protein n=1 Tax=Elysia marginata TaxID=1093978 RepID=A0AAV4IMI1_9GAST|nr:hypothetical protein ElyMa_003073100 [Elysia marginata]
MQAPDAHGLTTQSAIARLPADRPRPCTTQTQYDQCPLCRLPAYKLGLYCWAVCRAQLLRAAQHEKCMRPASFEICCCWCLTIPCSATAASLDLHRWVICGHLWPSMTLIISRPAVCGVSVLLVVVLVLIAPSYCPCVWSSTSEHTTCALR